MTDEGNPDKAAPLPRSWTEVTAHRKSGDDLRFDIGQSPAQPSGGVWERAIIENAAGRTTEFIEPRASAPRPPAFANAT